MRRPLVLATALAADLALGTFAVVPPATAQPAPPPADPPTVEPTDRDPGPVDTDPVDTDPAPVPVPVRTGRADTPVVDVPTEAPVAAPGDTPDGSPAVVAVPVRSGRLGADPVEASASAPSSPARPPATERHPEGPGRTGTGRSTTSPRRDDRAAEPPSDVPAPAPSPAPVSPPPAAPLVATRVVHAGDHLWSIAAEQVATASGRTIGDLTAGDVVTYWVHLCMANRPQLRSGNPSLIYPGEVLTLPPV